MRIFAALCLALSCLPALAQETPAPKACRPLGNLLRSIESIVSEDKRFEAHVYADDRAQKIIDIINAEPPETDYKADRIVVLIYNGEDRPKAAQSFLIVNGCVTRQAITSLQWWQGVVKRALGDES